MKIEVGKKYRRRDGEIVKVDRFDQSGAFGDTHPYFAGGWSYDGEGRYDACRSKDDELDLVEEIVEQTTAVAAGVEALAKQARGEFTTYAEVGAIEGMRDALADQQFNPYAALAQALGPGAQIHYVPPSIEPTDLLAALRMLLREVDAGTSGGRIRIDGSAALIDAATLARAVIQRYAT